MKLDWARRACVAAAIGILPLAAAAQDASELSAEEIGALFQTQKTRGLVIAPAADAAPATAAGVDAAAATQAAAQTYVQVDPQAQVNIRIAFDFDSAALRETEKAKLVTLCQAMQASDVALFRIVGHTDSAGAASYNERLSLLRAQEVKRHLVSDCGLPETRLEAIGVGPSYPLDAADPRSDVNRRVEVQVVG